MSHRLRELWKSDTERVEPVTGARIRFFVWAFDFPKNYIPGLLEDNPHCIFINGIKLDFSLLLSQTGVKRGRDKYTRLAFVSGTSFAGITWIIKEEKNLGRFYGDGPDWRYLFEINVPQIVFDHINHIDIEFIFKKENGKAKFYGLGTMSLDLRTVPCEIKGLENSPFEDFKSVVESRLREKLGLDVAREYHKQQGHCLYDSIPVVSAHLVEKQTWEETKPRCG